MAYFFLPKTCSRVDKVKLSLKSVYLESSLAGWKEDILNFSMIIFALLFFELLDFPSIDLKGLLKDTRLPDFFIVVARCPLAQVFKGESMLSSSAPFEEILEFSLMGTMDLYFSRMSVEGLESSGSKQKLFFHTLLAETVGVSKSMIDLQFVVFLIGIGATSIASSSVSSSIFKDLFLSKFQN